MLETTMICAAMITVALVLFVGFGIGLSKVLEVTNIEIPLEKDDI